MNKQKRSNAGMLLIIAAMLFISGNLIAQPRQNRNQPPKPPSTEEVNKMVDELSVKLSLDKVQKQKVSELFAAHFNETRESPNNKENNMSREEMESKRRNFEEQVKSLLNYGQKVAFDNFMKSRGPQHNQQMPKQ